MRLVVPGIRRRLFRLTRHGEQLHHARLGTSLCNDVDGPFVRPFDHAFRRETSQIHVMRAVRQPFKSHNRIVAYWLGRSSIETDEIAIGVDVVTSITAVGAAGALESLHPSVMAVASAIAALGMKCLGLCITSSGRAEITFGAHTNANVWVTIRS